MLGASLIARGSAFYSMGVALEVLQTGVRVCNKKG